MPVPPNTPLPEYRERGPEHDAARSPTFRNYANIDESRMTMLPFPRFAIAVATAAALLTSAAFGVGTSTWTQTSESDFKDGTFENVVATNLGDLKLSRAVQTLLEQDPKISSVNALAEGPDGTIYAGTGPHGVVLRIKGDDVKPILTLEDDGYVFSLAFDK